MLKIPEKDRVRDTDDWSCTRHMAHDSFYRCFVVEFIEPRCWL